MLHKSSSRVNKKSPTIHSQKMKSTQQTFFSEMDINQVPPMIKQTILASHHGSTKIITLKSQPHGWVHVFCMSFLNIYFTNKQAFDQNIQKIFDLIDEDQFKFFRPIDNKYPHYTDWSNSKIKRVLALHLRDIAEGKYNSLFDILARNNDLKKIIFLFTASVLFYCEKMNDFQHPIDLDTVKQTLFDYFDISLLTNDQGNIIIPDSQMSIYSFAKSEDLYLVVEKPSEPSECIKTNQEIRLSNISSFESQLNDPKLQLIQNHGFMISSPNSIENQNFQDLTHQICNIHQNYVISPKTHKTQQVKFQFSFIDQQQNHNKENLSKHSPNQGKNKIILSTQGTQWTCKKNNQSQIQKLFQMKGRPVTTQKSIYDDPEEAQSPDEEYSFLDEDLPPSRKTSQKKTIKPNNSTDDSAKSENQTLMNKWYEFIREKRNKAKNVEIIKNTQKATQKVTETTSNLKNILQDTAKKVLVKPTRLTSNEKPDFKKIKSRRRNTQKSQSQQKSLTSACILKSMKSEQNFEKVCESTQNLPCKKQIRMSIQDQVDELSKQNDNTNIKKMFILNPGRMSIINDKNFSYFSEFKISQQFTDSVILNQMNEKSQMNIKLMKQKARNQRDSVGMRVKTRNTVK